MTTYEISKYDAIQVLIQKIPTLPKSQLESMLDVLGYEQQRNFEVLATKEALNRSKWQFKINHHSEFDKE